MSTVIADYIAQNKTITRRQLRKMSKDTTIQDHKFAVLIRCRTAHQTISL